MVSVTIVWTVFSDTHFAPRINGMNARMAFTGATFWSIQVYFLELDWREKRGEKPRHL